MSGGNRRIVVLLGMHRSGTSAITRGLTVLGVRLGNRLIEGIAGENDRGFWEDADINAFNEALLARIGSGWHGLAVVSDSVLTGDALETQREQARNLLAEKLDETAVFGFKDPRTAVLLPFWQAVFASLGLKDCYVIALRHPCNVSASLSARNGFPHEKSMLLWIKHMIGALQHTRGRRRVVVSYDALLEAPHKELDRISTALSLPRPDESGSELDAYVSGFLARDLRHNQYTVESETEDFGMPPFISTAYDWLGRLARDEVAFGNPAFNRAWKQVIGAYDEFVSFYPYMDRLETERAAADQTIDRMKMAESRLRADLSGAVEGRDNARASVERVSSELAAAKAQLESALGECRSAVEQRDRAVARTKDLEQERNDALLQRDLYSRERDQMLRQRDQVLAEKASVERELEALATDLQTSQESAQNARDLADCLASERAAAINRSEVALEELRVNRGRLNEASAELAAARFELDWIKASKSWRWTLPLRVSRRAALTRPYWLLREKSSNLVRSAWTTLPVSMQFKIDVKERLFRTLPGLFKGTAAYRDWKDFTKQTPAYAVPERFPAATREQMSPESVSREEEQIQPVPLLHRRPLNQVPVRLIAFYLPQFHPIPENDAWWGKGFTEWTNVKSGKPQFLGHYQPHVPGELGYYDLRDVQIQRRQVSLAKTYGIGGFCFYFYWFGGKRLLEAPVLQYRDHPDLELPYCLCWANENWSRRWDGLENDILIGQHHSPADDLAFIAYVSKYFKDERYIRVGGKPLLIVYRPSLLPSPKETVRRWRKWCRESGIGEIYLAYTQSFEAVNPSLYGFDAAIEFPPNNSSPPNVTDQVDTLGSGFSGMVFDWSALVERSRSYRKTAGYPVFRGVCPSWDNTARRKGGGNVFLNSTPLGYLEWLMNGIRETLAARDEPEERLMFVNAWNEWAEGAHLEPDARYGYAYLEATRMAFLRTGAQATVPAAHDGGAMDSSDRLAIVIHAYYVDVFADLLRAIGDIGVDHKLFVTTPPENEAAVADLLAESGCAHHLAVLANHGRDVLPFLRVMEQVTDEGFTVFLKLHTKRSRHRQDGEAWRRDIYVKLLSAESAAEIISGFNSRSELGMVGPQGHIVPMSTYWGANREKVLWLSARMGVTEEQVIEQPFVAGTMFYARTDAVMPLLNVALSQQDFEPEEGQIDGTMAHAVERALSVSVLAAGMSLVCTDSISKRTSTEVGVEDNYRYAHK